LRPGSNIDAAIRAREGEDHRRTKCGFPRPKLQTTASRRFPIGNFHDRVSMFIREHTNDPAAVLAWRDQQRIAFQTFFAHDKNAALDLKRQFEALETGTEVVRNG
jgi:hypothetical protein